MATIRKRIRRSSRIPSGLIYRPDLISIQEEQELIAAIQQLPFENALYHDYVAKRRIVAFGVDYSFETRQVTPGDPIPQFLFPVRERVSALVPGLSPQALVEGLATEYQPGTCIGWHRDAPQFGLVFGISLASACRMRFRLTTDDEYEITSLYLEPRSVYVFQGESRWKWQHSIPAVKQLRYSITFRTLRSGTHISSQPLVA